MPAGPRVRDDHGGHAEVPFPPHADVAVRGRAVWESERKGPAFMLAALVTMNVNVPSLPPPRQRLP